MIGQGPEASDGLPDLGEDGRSSISGWSPGVLVALPDVARVPQEDAEEALLEAGFAPRSVPVCSSSVPEGAVRQVVMLEGDGEIEVVGLGGVVPTASHLERARTSS